MTGEGEGEGEGEGDRIALLAVKGEEMLALEGKGALASLGRCTRHALHLGLGLGRIRYA